MRRTLFSFLAMFLTLGIAQAQINVTFNASATNDPGEPIAVDVVVNDFTDIIGVQFSVNWDSLVMSYSSISNLNTDIGLTEDLVGTPVGSAAIVNGQTTISWFSTNPITLADGTVLFTINMIGEDNPCGETMLTISDNPRNIEILDDNIDDIGATVTEVPVMIAGMDCEGGGGGGTDDLTFTVADAQAGVGTNVCFPISVQNFTNLLSGQGSVTWDPAVLSYTGITNQGVPSTDLILNANNALAGELIFIFDDTTPSTSETLDDGSSFFDICFDITGSDGQCSDITLGEGALEWVFSDDSGADVPSTLENGEICAVTEVADPVIVNVSSGSGDKGEQVCVDVNVQNFNCLGFQFTVEYDSDVLDFTEAKDFNLMTLSTTNFNEVSDGKVRINWTPIDCQAVADNSSIFSMCFDLIGECDESSDVNIVDDTNFDISFFDCDTDNLTDMVSGGSISIECDPTPMCTVTGSQNVNCFGESTGSITVDIPGASSDCECVWTKDGSALITLPVSNCNLTNIGAGTYNLSVTCNGTEFCSLEQVISQAPVITIGGAVVNAGCEGVGSIAATASGGTGTLVFRWTDDNSMDPNRGMLLAGTYTLEVTDGNMCVTTRDFLVGEEIDDLIIDATPTNVLCFGDSDGALDLAVVGGCPDYTYQWDDAASSMTEDIANLPAGTYNVTVTDSQGTTATAAFMISQPTSAVTVTGTVVNASGGANGSILITEGGGTIPYTNVWTNGIPPNTTNPMNLAANMYTVTVTDANGCSAVESFTVEDLGGTLTIGSLSVTSEAEFGGFGVACSGDANAVVTGSVGGGASPYTISGAGDDITLSEAGIFMIEDLAAGTYTIVVTDGTGASVQQIIIVTEPELLVISAPSVDCADGSFTNGSIEVDVMGGSTPYSYQWNVDDGTPDDAMLSDIGVGTYSVIVTDANDCQVLRNSIRVNDCTVGGGDCYKAITIITPNNDGMNDAFVINCAMDFPATLHVYDRWAREVYTQENYDNTWMGINSNTIELREGAYMWVLDVDFGQGRKEIYKGTVTLLRD